MIRKIINSFVGVTIASLGVASVVKAGFGAFPITATNLSLSNMFGISVAMAGIIVEAVVILIAILLKEKIGIGTLINSFWGSICVDVFLQILPTSRLMILGMLLMPIGWKILGQVRLGDTSSNALMNGLCRKTNKSVGLIRGIEEVTFMAIGFIGAREYVTLFTIVLSLFFGKFLDFIWKLLKYNPVEVEHMSIGHCGVDISENN